MQFDLLRGMGYSNSDAESNGERRVLERFAAGAPVIVDVGANRGDFSARALAAAGPKASIFAFEPSRAAYAVLAERFAGEPRVRLLPFGLGDEDRDDAQLHADRPGSPHGSLYARAGLDQESTEAVQLRRLDRICAQLGIGRIDYLKVDAEGHDVAVLAGAGALLHPDSIGAIQFEHGGTAPDARVFLRDFFDLLVPAYRVHRILPDGLWPIERYSEVEEVSLYANYVALPADTS